MASKPKSTKATKRVAAVTPKAKTTRSRAKAAPKTASKDTPKTVAKAVAEAAVTAATVETPAELLKKPELIDRAVARSGVKKKDAKPAIEAALAVLGEALAAGNDMSLPPLGRIKVVRSKEQPNADVIVCRVRRPRAAAPDPENSNSDQD